MKNRDYTGLERTPSSMAWLIGQRARVKGQLDRLRRLEGTLPERIEKFVAELAALDAVIPRHEVKVDPQVIKGQQSYRPRAAPHGVMTKSILKQLRLAAGKPVYTAEITLKFARDNPGSLSILTHAELTDRVRKRLATLTKEGTVRRHHPARTREQGLWSLVLGNAEHLPTGMASRT